MPTGQILEGTVSPRRLPSVGFSFCFICTIQYDCLIFLYLRVDYQYESDGYQLCCVTTDHNCLVQEERKMVQHFSSDPNPLRPSEIGKRTYGINAPDRVAGSLAITRAMGDGYLKKQEVRYVCLTLCNVFVDV